MWILSVISQEKKDFGLAFFGFEQDPYQQEVVDHGLSIFVKFCGPENNSTKFDECSHRENL